MYQIILLGGDNPTMEDFMAKAKKSTFMGLLPHIVLLLVAILVFVFLATPLSKVVTTTTVLGKETVTEESKTAYKFLEEMGKQDEDGNSTIKLMKDTIAKAEENGLEKDELQYTKNTITVYDSLLAIIALAAIAMVTSILGIVLALLKKGKLGFILALVTIVLLLAIFICACIQTGAMNSLLEILNNNVGGDNLGMKIDAKTIAPILVLVASLVGVLAGGATAFLAKKKA